MSWSIELKADRKLSVKVVDSAVRSLALKYQGVFLTNEFNCRQEWGWSMACDVGNPKGKTLFVSGAGFSRDIACEFARALAAALRRRKYKIAVGERTD